MVALTKLVPEAIELAWPIDGWLVAPIPFPSAKDASQASTSAAVGDPFAPTPDLLEQRRWARERAAIEAEDIITQAEEAGGLDPIG